MNKHYQPADVELQVQAAWEEAQAFEVKENLSKEKFYCLGMMPYPSGELHIGHVRNYTIADTIARYQRMQGKNVLHPMAWDAFGLPAENAALKHKLAPSKWTYKNIKQMRKQMKRLGLGIDWSREIATCKPEYYRWEQWLFTKLYKKGLVYRKNSVVNWDPIDKTVLANEQVINGRGWRSGAEIEQREIPQWFLKITDYADQLLNDLEQLTGWPKQVKTIQQNWIGRSEGVETTFDIKNSKEKITIFTTCPHTLLGMTFIAIAPGHPLAKEAAKHNQRASDFIKQCKKTKLNEADAATIEKKGIQTKYKAIHPLTGAQIPVWIANYVLMDYGFGAVMAVPAHDQRDFEFAKQYDIPIKIVVQPKGNKQWDYEKSAYMGDGTLINSEAFNGLTVKQAFKAMGHALIKKNKGNFTTHYRLRDWGVSRQRYWGAPIPIIYCNDCGTVPVPEKDLPVVLPEDIELTGPGSPLASLPSFYKTKCPNCGKNAKRETDTFDTFMESSWYYARLTCKDQNKAMLDDRTRYWTPVDHYIGGIEHAALHLLYARFLHKVLRDEGLINNDEPFMNLLTQGMVLKGGAKMSKSRGNVVTPKSIIDKYGADTVRTFVIFASPPEQTLEWSESGVEGTFRFLKRLWTFCYEHQEVIQQHNQQKQKPDWQQANDKVQDLRRKTHQILSQANKDAARFQLNTIVSACMKLLNLLTKENYKTEHQQLFLQETLNILLRLLSPIAPHICQHLWQTLKYGDNIIGENWPKIDSKALRSNTIEMVVQVNGKLRAKIFMDVDAKQKEIEKTVLNNEKIQKFIADKKAKKVIVVPNKLVNVVV